MCGAYRVARGGRRRVRSTGECVESAPDLCTVGVACWTWSTLRSQTLALGSIPHSWVLVGGHHASPSEVRSQTASSSTAYSSQYRGHF